MFQTHINDVGRSADIHIEQQLAIVWIDRNHTCDVNTDRLHALLDRKERLKRSLITEVTIEDLHIPRDVSCGLVALKHKSPHLITTLQKLSAHIRTHKTGCSRHKINYIFHTTLV